MSNFSLTKIQIFSLFCAYIIIINLFAFGSNIFIYQTLWLNLTFILIFTPSILLPNKVFKVVLAITALVTYISSYTQIFYKVRTSESLFLESQNIDVFFIIELINFESFIYLALILISLFAIYKINITQIKFKMNLAFILITALICIFLAFSFFYVHNWQVSDKKGIIRDNRFKTSLNFFEPVNSIYQYKKYLEDKNSFAKPKFKLQLENTNIIKHQNLKIVLILGETARGDRFEINGCNKNTNPYLKDIQNIISFKNVTSCATSTRASLFCMLTRTKAGEKFNQEESIISLFKKNGFYTQIISAQNNTELYNYIDYDSLVEIRNNLIKDRISDKYIIDFYKIQDGNELTILHMLGSHADYNHRIYTNYKFTPLCTSSNINNCTQHEIDNSYDNTIVQTDTFLKDIIDKFENQNAILVYISDHGESLGENGVYYHAGDEPHQFNVPWIFWFSNTFKNNNLDIFKKIKQYENIKLSHDNLFHTMLGCFLSSNTKLIDKKLNLCKDF